MSRLDRLRELVSPPDGSTAPTRPRRRASIESAPETARVLGGALEQGPDGSCLVVRQTYAAGEPYGRHLLATYPASSTGPLGVLAGHSDGRDRPCKPEAVVCFDLETTGLSGGAGTVAFLIGLGWFHDGSFRTCQYFLDNMADERRMLLAAADLLRTADTIVTFNGRSFDLPVMETRFALHRLRSPLTALRHVDLLHPGRHLWKGEQTRLARLERDVLGLHRVGDVPGAEIPGRYVGYLRSGDARSLAPVLEHNRLDLVSLGVLTGLACQLVRDGARAADGASQALGLGRIFERVGQQDRAVACYQRAARSVGADATPVDAMARPQALRRLAGIYRRQRRHTEAAAAWMHLLSLPGVSTRLRHDASVALAVHQEHRVRDLWSAHRYASSALGGERHPTRRSAVEHRLTRIRRKIDAAEREERVEGNLLH